MPAHSAFNSKHSTMTAFFLIALSTLVSEDLACIAAGRLPHRDRRASRLRRLLFHGHLRWRHAPLCHWPRVRKTNPGGSGGFSVICRWNGLKLLQHGLPKGERRSCSHAGSCPACVPVYVAAGLFRTDFGRYTLYFAIAAGLWTPTLVGATVWLGRDIVASSVAVGWQIAITGGLAVGALFGFRKLLAYNVRRRLLGFVLRKVRWEFWPLWAAYLPVVPYILYLGLKHRSLTLFTAANPGIPAGGLAGESKSEILNQLAPSGAVAKYRVVQGPVATEFPVVLKPDVGERGSGVVIAHSPEELNAICGLG